MIVYTNVNLFCGSFKLHNRLLICRYILLLLSKELSSSTSNFACQKASFGLGSSTFYEPFLLILYSKSTSLEDVWCNNSSQNLVDGIVRAE